METTAKKTMEQLMERADVAIRERQPAALDAAERSGVAIGQVGHLSWFHGEVMDRIASLEPAFRHLRELIYG